MFKKAKIRRELRHLQRQLDEIILELASARIAPQNPLIVAAWDAHAHDVLNRIVRKKQQLLETYSILKDIDLS